MSELCGFVYSKGHQKSRETPREIWRSEGELSDSDHMQHPGDPKKSSGFIYRGTKVHWTVLKLAVLAHRPKSSALDYTGPVV